MNPSQNSIIIRVHEIALKGKNRPMFLKRLENNLKQTLKGLPVENIQRSHVGIEITSASEDAWEEISEKIKLVFGVVKFYRAYKIFPSIDAIKNFMTTEVPKLSFDSFRITARRGDKRFPMTSPEINQELGRFVQSLTGAKVDLENPNLNLFVEILPSTSMVYFREYSGPGGLPVGVSGKVMALLSGGIDSPVAARRMMKRGCQVSFVHFHSFPLLDGSSREKAEDLVYSLNRYQFRSTLFLVPFSEIQKEIILSVPPQYRIIIYRRFMARISERIATSEGAKALVTGESLGQVGSQTLENIATIRDSINIPILSPLIGMDKQEIITEAIRIGTYNTSIMPDEDCCSLFVPKHPATKSTPDQIQFCESALDVERLVKLAMDNIEIKKFAAV